MYERTRRIGRFRNVDPEIALVFRDDDVIGCAFYTDHHAGGGLDLKFDHHPTV